MLRILFIVAWLGAVGYLLNQVRKPSRWLGRAFLKDMNRRHSAVTDWGLGHVQIHEQRTILDIGCGGGRTLEKLAALAPAARICGVDYAVGSVAESRAHNAALIAAGRAEVVRASVASLPWPNEQFDLVTAIETHYYWPDLVANLAEARRVLRPGGTLVMIAETFKGPRSGWLEGAMMARLRAAHLSPEDHRRALAEAGFELVVVATEPKKNWICAVGRAPERGEPNAAS